MIKDQINSEIGKKFQTLRKAASKTQQEVADYLDIPRTAIVHIESGFRLAAAWELVKAAELFEVEVESC